MLPSRRSHPGKAVYGRKDSLLLGGHGTTAGGGQRPQSSVLRFLIWMVASGVWPLHETSSSCSVRKGRSTKVHLVKAMVFPVVMYQCESWTIKKAEHQRIDALNCGVGEDS